MSSIKCFDIAKTIIEEADKRFKPIWGINKERYSILEQYCSSIDSLSKEFDGNSLEVSVDEIKMNITIILECEDISISSECHLLYELIKRSETIGFSISGEEKLNIKFVFPSLWERI